MFEHRSETKRPPAGVPSLRRPFVRVFYLHGEIVGAEYMYAADGRRESAAGGSDVTGFKEHLSWFTAMLPTSLERRYFRPAGSGAQWHESALFFVQCGIRTVATGSMNGFAYFLPNRTTERLGGFGGADGNCEEAICRGLGDDRKNAPPGLPVFFPRERPAE
jgi:hypothetical protein